MELTVTTKKRGEVVDLTAAVKRACKEWGGSGLLNILCPHTTAGVTLNENYDPTVKEDLLQVLARLVPEGGAYTHGEGNSDAHVKAVLVGPQVTLPVVKGKPRLGRWQGVYFCEFDGPRHRTLWLTFLKGE